MLPSPQSKEYLESTASLEEEESGDDGDDLNDKSGDQNKYDKTTKMRVGAKN